MRNLDIRDKLITGLECRSWTYSGREKLDVLRGGALGDRHPV
jgi:hypothetical protein